MTKEMMVKNKKQTLSCSRKQPKKNGRMGKEEGEGAERETIKVELSDSPARY